MSDKWVVGGVTQSVILTPAVSASPGRASEMHFSGPIPIPDLLKQNLGGQQGDKGTAIHQLSR